MMRNQNNLAAIILAAGYSSRMGEFKALLKIGDKPALETQVQALKAANIKNIIVVKGYRKELIEPILQRENVVGAYNSHYENGMFSSIQEGLKAVYNKDFDKDSDKDSGENLAAGVFIMPVDCPLIPSWVIEEIAKEHAENPKAIIVPCFRGKKGHPVFLPRELAEEAIKYNGTGGLKAITNRHEEKMIRLEVGTEAVILDMDTKEGYEEILRFYQTHEKEINRKMPLNDEKAYRDYYTDLVKKSGIKRIIFVRHGQPLQHSDKIFLGQRDLPLSEEGREQSFLAGMDLQKVKVKADYIYSSDLKRALATADAINKAYKGNGIKEFKIKSYKGLREINLGLWDGKLISQVQSEFPGEYEKRGRKLLEYKIGKNAESFYDLQYRVMKQFEEILKEDQNEDLVLVTHGGVIRIILGNLQGKPLNESIKRSVKTGEVIVFAV